MEALGLISDTHGHAERAAKAIRLLTARGATRFIHLGDVGGEAVIDALAGHVAHLVFGNCDHDDAAQARYARSLGLTVDHPAGRLEFDGKLVAFTHGHLDRPLREAMDSAPDYLLHGHTHEVRDDRVGSVRVINPGALSRAARFTVALLEPGSDRLTIIDVPR